jgi:hypothetical protein
MMKPTKKCYDRLLNGELDIKDIKQQPDDVMSGILSMDEIEVEGDGDTTTLHLKYKGDSLFKVSADHSNRINITDIDIRMVITIEI